MANRIPRKSMQFTMSLCVCTAVLLSACDRNNDDDDGSGDGLLDDEATSVVVAPPQGSEFGVDVLLLDQNGLVVSDATLLVINDELNGDIVPDEAELFVVEEGSIRVPLNTFEGSAVIRLEAEKDGFFSNGGRYELIAGEDLAVDIVLTSEESDIEGIRVVNNAGDVSQGSISVSATSVNDSENVLTSVTIPQGLEILDVEGNALNDSLSLSVVHYDSRDESALSAFPGGFDVVIENVAQIDTPAIEGTIPSQITDEEISPNVTFQSVGFTAVEIFDSEGNKADTFAGSIDVVMAIPPGTLNPQTRQPIQVGDIIPVWSFDTDTANWEYEGREPVEADGRGGLQVSYTADHLSYWNLDYWTSSSCNVDLDVGVVSSDGQPVNDTLVTVTILGTDANVGYRRSRTLNSGSIQLRRVPGTFPVSVRIASAIPGVTIQSITRNGAAFAPGESFQLCDANGVGIPSTFSVQTDQVLDDIIEAGTIDYPVSVSAQCTNSPETAQIPLQNATVRYYSSDYSTRLSATTDGVGNALLQGQGDPSGFVQVWYYSSSDSRWLFARQTVDSNTANVDIVLDTQCVVTTGAVGQ